MDQAHQPPEDDALDLLLGRARHLILSLIGIIDSVLERLGGVPMSAPLIRRLMRRALIPAESALRRAILLIAATLPAPGPRAVPNAAKPQSGKVSLPRASAPRPPAFRMSELQPRMGKSPKTDDLPEHMMPRITLLVDSVLRARSAPVKARAAPRDPSIGFQRRLDALRSAFNDPVSAAHRWLRRCAASAAAVVRVLAAGKIPGAYRSLGPANLDLMRELTRAARHTLGLNTS